MAETALSEKSSQGERALLLCVALFGSMYLVVRPAANQFMPYTIEAAFAALIAILFGVCSAFRVFVAKPALRIPPALAIASVLWSSIFIFGALRSPNPGVGIPQACDALIYLLMLLSGFFVARREPALLCLFSRAFIAMAVVEACFAIWQRYVDLPFLHAQIRSGTEAVPAALQSTSGLSRLYGYDAFGSFGNPNSLAAFLVVGLWLAAGHCSDLAAAGKKKMLPALVFIAVLAAALLLTNSKGGNVACLVGAWFFLLQRVDSKSALYRALRNLTFAGAAFGIALLVVAYFNKIAVPQSVVVRLDYWRAAFAMIAKHPFDGVGMAGFAENYPYFKTLLGTETKEAHNDYIHLFAELGVLGPLVYVATWFMLLRGGRSQATTTALPAPSPENSRNEKLVIGGGVLAFVFMYLGFQPFNSAEIFRLLYGSPNSQSMLNAVFALALPVVFVCVVVSMRPREKASAAIPAGLQRGFNAAAGALLIHQLVDFDFKAQAVIGGMFLIGGMLYGLRCAAQEESSGNTSPPFLSFAARFAPLALGVVMLPFAVLIPMNSGSHRARAEALEADAIEFHKTKPPDGENIEADKKYRSLRRDVAEARLEAARAAPYDAGAWLDLVVALQTVQREYGSISVHKEILAALDEADRLRPLAAYPKVMRGDIHFYRAMDRVKHQASGDEDYRQALEAYSVAAARYPLAPGLLLLKGDALIMLGRPIDAAAEYLDAFKTDMRIYDINVRLNAAFTDPRPGALPRHGFERQVSANVQHRLFTAQVRPETVDIRRGLLIRRAISLAALLQENRRISAMKPAAVVKLESELIGMLQTFMQLTTDSQQRAHAALYLALAHQLTPSAPDASRAAAWQQARQLQQESVAAGQPGTPPSLFSFLLGFEKLEPEKPGSK